MIPPDLVAARIRQLPTLSAAAVRITELARDERSSAADLERALRNDAALTANLLRIVNAAAFGLRARAESVRHAVAMLGLARTAQVAAAAALAPLVPAQVPGYAVSAREFWLHCVAVAALSERLAAALGQAGDRAFTAGLLHDVGKLAIGSFVAGASDEILGRVRGGEVLATAERAALGLDHAEVGSTLGEAWSLPPAVVAVARWHHAPALAAEGDRGLVDLVHVADALAHALGFGADAGELSRAVDRAAQVRLGLRAGDLERAAGQSLEEIKELAALFVHAGGGAG